MYVGIVIAGGLFAFLAAMEWWQLSGSEQMLMPHR